MRRACCDGYRVGLLCVVVSRAWLTLCICDDARSGTPSNIYLLGAHVRFNNRIGHFVGRRLRCGICRVQSGMPCAKLVSGKTLLGCSTRNMRRGFRGRYHMVRKRQLPAQLGSAMFLPIRRSARNMRCSTSSLLFNHRHFFPPPPLLPPSTLPPHTHLCLSLLVDLRVAMPTGTRPLHEWHLDA